ncbi:unnamed protein product [Boreogadus saida]
MRQRYRPRLKADAHRRWPGSQTDVMSALSTLSGRTAACSGPGEDVSGRDHLLLCSVSPPCSERACCGPTPRCILTPGPLLHRAAPDP